MDTKFTGYIHWGPLRNISKNFSIYFWRIKIFWKNSKHNFFSRFFPRKIMKKIKMAITPKIMLRWSWKLLFQSYLEILMGVCFMTSIYLSNFKGPNWGFFVFVKNPKITIFFFGPPLYRGVKFFFVQYAFQYVQDTEWGKVKKFWNIFIRINFLILRVMLRGGAKMAPPRTD